MKRILHKRFHYILSYYFNNFKEFVSNVKVIELHNINKKIIAYLILMLDLM